MLDYTALDLETTGFSSSNNDIIEIGAYKVKSGVVIDKFCTLVRPILYIPQVVQSLTGITMEAVKDCDVMEVVLPEFFDWCEDYHFLGHNLKFDFDFLMYKGKIVGVDFTLGGTRQGICTLELSRKFLNLESNKLESVMEHFKIHLNNDMQLHRAEVDALVTKTVYERFQYFFRGAGEVDLPSVLLVNTSKYGKVVNDSVLDFE